MGPALGKEVHFKATPEAPLFRGLCWNGGKMRADGNKWKWKKRTESEIIQKKFKKVYLETREKIDTS